MTDHHILTNDISGTLYRYLYIDHGAQFRVYAILASDGTPTGRVVKVPLDFNESKYVLTPYFSEAGIPDAEADRRIHKLMIQKQRLPELLQGIYAASPQLMGLLGNLKIVPILARPAELKQDYFMPLHLTQDHVTPMAEFLHPFRFADMPPQRITIKHVHQVRRIMRAIINLHYRLWEYGIMETTFKLENIGVVPNSNQVILVDAGEYTLKQHEAETIINEKKWRHALSPDKIDHLYLPSILHKEYSELCNTTLTLEAVRKHWNKRAHSIERRASQRIKLRTRLTHDPQKELALWIQQQTLSQQLHSGVPKERIENMLISHQDLTMLLEDKRVSIMPLTDIELQERAERDLASQDPQSWKELYRHLTINTEAQ